MKKPTLSHIHLNFHNIRISLSSAWVIGVAAAIVGTVVVALCAISFFIGVFDVDAVPVDAPSGIESISREDLSRAVRIIDARIADFERLKALTPTLPDPSR